MLEGKKGKGQFAMLQERMSEKRGECLNESRMVCWEWAFEGQSRVKRKKRGILVETVEERLSPLYFCSYLLWNLLRSFSWLEEHLDGWCQLQWQWFLEEEAVGASGRRMEWSVMMVSLLLSVFPF
jgi:hypothetical protein